MAGTIGVRIVRNNFGRTHQALRTDITTRVRNVATAIAGVAAQKAPVGYQWEHKEPYYPGYLRDHIKPVMVNQHPTWAVEAQAFYSPYVEFGTRFMAAQPFLLPALMEVKGIVNTIPGAVGVWVW